VNTSICLSTLLWILGLTLILGSYLIPASNAFNFNDKPSKIKSLASSNVLLLVKLIKFSWDRNEYLTVLNNSIFSFFDNLFNCTLWLQTLWIASTFLFWS